jgi:hypothetical protein
MSSVVLNADLVSAVLTPDLVSVVRRGASTSARYVGVFVVESWWSLSDVMIFSWGDRNPSDHLGIKIPRIGLPLLRPASPG